MVAAGTGRTETEGLGWGGRRVLRSCFQRQGETYRKERLVIRNEDDVGVRLSSRFVVKASINVSALLKHVATLPCEKFGTPMTLNGKCLFLRQPVLLCLTFAHTN